MKFQVTLLALLISAFAFVSPAILAEETAPQQQTEAQVQTVDINHADQAELETLPRVGPVIAARIIAFREEHGGFKTLEELMNVKGIGQKTFERLKPLISLGEKAPTKS